MAKTSILALALLLVLACSGATQTGTRNRSDASLREVKKVSGHSWTVADIRFDDFKFAQFQISHEGPALWPIRGQPTKATHYFVEPELYGHEAIANAKFEAVDQHGVLITIIPVLKQNAAGGDPFFYGMMLVPDRPFRIVVSGQAVDGRPYKLVYPSLFVPTGKPAKRETLIPPGTTPDEAKKIRAWLAEEARQQYIKIKQEFEKLPGGVIVMPRTRVSNVKYAPLFSPLGQPRGVRISYEVEFSDDGYYNPELHVYPEYENEEWRGKVEMRVLNGRIEPQPTEESPQVRPNPLAYGAGYDYRAHTTYRFTAELIPDYVIQNEQQTKFCLYNNRFDSDQRSRAIWAALLASKTPTTYRVYIENSDFEGVIENFYPQHVLYNTFVAEGARDCGR